MKTRPKLAGARFGRVFEDLKLTDTVYVFISRNTKIVINTYEIGANI